MSVTTMSGRKVLLGFAVRHAQQPADRKKDGEQGATGPSLEELLTYPVFSSSPRRILSGLPRQQISGFARSSYP